jgi:AcrR family transcriptional regulator
MTIKSYYHKMAYEVTKTSAGRSYRYQVERVRDPGTGKTRSRWTYLGRASSGAATTAPRRRGTDARRRLLDALERLLATHDFASVTASAIVAEAGFAHGTFYRHFRDKRDALRAALERIREARGPLTDQLRADVGNPGEARAAFGAFVGRVLRAPAEHPALLRAYYALALRDEAISRERRERVAATTQAVASYMALLAARGFADVADPEATATAVLAMIEGLYREAVLAGSVPDERRIEAGIAVVERAVFGDLGRREAP